MRKKFKIWLLTQQWLWKKVVFDNGIVSSNYVRYDHLLLPQAEGMGDNGCYGGKKEAIERCLFLKSIRATL